MEKVLENLYYAPPEPSAYSGSAQVLRATRKKYRNNKVIDWLEGQDAHTLHKPVRRHYPRRYYNVYSPDEVWEGDLIDLKALKSYNDEYTYLLVVIDVLSKYAWVEPLKDKTASSVSRSFSRILSHCNGRRPLLFQTDKGKEFMGKEMQDLLKKEKIIHRIARNPDIKAAVAERFNRTLKGRLWRFFTHQHTRRYLNVLGDIVKAYNNSWHSGIRMVPSEVNLYNAARARHNLALRYNCHIERKPKYAVGDLVRVTRSKAVFGKAYEGEWTLELFRIIRISTIRQPPVYMLEDLAGDKIDGLFYEEELSRVRKNLDSDVFEIDEVLGSKGRGRTKKFLVSWKGYPEKFNSWVSAKALKNL